MNRRQSRWQRDALPAELHSHSLSIDENELLLYLKDLKKQPRIYKKKIFFTETCQNNSEVRIFSKIEQDLIYYKRLVIIILAFLKKYIHISKATFAFSADCGILSFGEESTGCCKARLKRHKFLCDSFVVAGQCEEFFPGNHVFGHGLY